MKANPAGLVLWILGASGTFLLYCAVKGYTPQSVLAAFVNRDLKPVPFTRSGGGATTISPTGTVQATSITGEPDEIPAWVLTNRNTGQGPTVLPGTITGKGMQP